MLDLLSRALGEGYLALDEYDHRSGRVGAAKLMSELTAQVEDLPAAFRWDPAAPPTLPPPPVPVRAPAESSDRFVARAALVAGIVSVPLGLIVIGVVAAVVAVALSFSVRPASPHRGIAVVGRVCGCVGAALAALMLILVIAMPTPTP